VRFELLKAVRDRVRYESRDLMMSRGRTGDARIFGDVEFVTAVDKDADKVAMLNRHEIPIYEPGLKELVETNTTLSAGGNSSFSASNGG
jgi:hypothetical protein